MHTNLFQPTKGNCYKKLGFPLVNRADSAAAQARAQGEGLKREPKADMNQLLDA